jgi:addiction module HigA family antidote
MSIYVCSCFGTPTITEEVIIMARNPIHPGKFLADELEALNMNATELAEALHVPPNRIYQILQGKQAITADTALRLSQWHGGENLMGTDLHFD